MLFVISLVVRTQEEGLCLKICNFAKLYTYSVFLLLIGKCVYELRSLGFSKVRVFFMEQFFNPHRIVHLKT